MDTRGRALAALAGMMALALGGCIDSSSTQPPDEFAFVIVEEVLSIEGPSPIWLIRLDMLNQDEQGVYFLRFTNDTDCDEETPPYLATPGRDWDEELTVTCRDQPTLVEVISQRPEGYTITDQDSLPILDEEPPL